MAPERTIRDARREDAEELVRAHEVAWDATLASIAGKRLGELASVEQRAEAFRKGIEAMSPDLRIWVAERDGGIVGEAICIRRGDICELRDLYVVPDAWGSGIAQDLMQTALDAMRVRGATEAMLWVVEANGRARRFYEREGWSADGQTRDSALGPRELSYRRSL